MMDAPKTLVAAALRAPSGDNTQPWRFAIDEAAGRIRIYLDPERDPSPMNAGQRMARIAIGAAVENMLHTAAQHGWTVRCDTPRRSEVLVEVRLLDAEPAAGAVPTLVAARVTNRRPYDGRAAPALVLARLCQATPPRAGVWTHWLADRQRLPVLADLVGQADALLFGARCLRETFFGNVRFDRPAAEAVATGLSLASLELGVSDRLALRCLRRLPDWAVRYGGALRQFAAHARRLVRSASGLCIVTADDDPSTTDVAVGRAVQRAWLALTEAGLAAQPMMSLAVLEGIGSHTPSLRQTGLPGVELALLRERCQLLLPEIGSGRLAFLLRFGFAPPPSGRTGRLPLADVTAFVPQPRRRLAPAGREA